MALADVIWNLPSDGGFLDKLFHQTWITFNIFGLFGTDGYKLTLAALIILVIVAGIAAAIAERLAGDKPGKSFVTTLLLTILGAYIFTKYVSLPISNLQIETVNVISALLGAIVFGVFYVLIRRQSAPKKA